MDSLRFICGVMLPFVVALAVVVLVLTSAGMLAFGKFRPGAQALRALVGLVAVCIVVLMAVSLLTPQKIGGAGQAYCLDIWCIGIEKVNPMPARNQVTYTIDVRIFSDANTVKTRVAEASRSFWWADAAAGFRW